jgi:hypothetical protein
VANQTFEPGDLYRVTHNGTLWWISNRYAGLRRCQAVCVKTNGVITDGVLAMSDRVTVDQIIIARGITEDAARAAGQLLTN